MASDKPLVTIGIPAYNGGKYMRRTLESLTGQDFENTEILINDNASTDETEDICREFAERDSRIDYVRNPSNLGAMYNWLNLVDRAKGKYFMWCAVDDYWDKEFVSVLVNELELHKDAGVAMTASQIRKTNGELFWEVRFKGKFDPNKQSYFKMMKGTIAPPRKRKRFIPGRWKQKYNIYTYGLFRTEVLREVVPFILDMLVNDRFYIGIAALAVRFRYVDRVLFYKTRRDDTYYERYENAYAHVINKSKREHYMTAIELGKVAFRSKIIPWKRKIYIPIAVWWTYRVIAGVVNSEEWKKVQFHHANNSGKLNADNNKQTVVN